MEELNRRKVICHTHPFRAEPMYSLLPDRRAMGITLATDTTITIQSILYTNTAACFPTSPSSGRRRRDDAVHHEPVRCRQGPDGKPNATLAIIQRFYYDTAQAFTPYTLDGFTKLIPNSHILFGSDYLGNAGSAGNVVKGLEATRASRRRNCGQSNATTRSSCFHD